MGLCLEEFGHISVEIRRESFIIHSMQEGEHPEYMLGDLDDLIGALQDAKRYLAKRRQGKR